jgi:opacity protein-like surface antigen
MTLGLVLAGAVLAAPSPARAENPKADFEGPTLGIQIGYGFGASDWCFCNFATPAVEAVGGDGGVLGGVHAGYGVRLGPFVLQSEARLSYATIAFSELCRPQLSCAGETEWLGEIDASLGLVVFGDIMIAASAGFATGDVRATTVVLQGPNAGAAREESATHDGSVLGARIEQAMSGGWRYGLEYRYYDMQGENLAAAPSGPPAKAGIDWTAHTVGLSISLEL